MKEKGNYMEQKYSAKEQWKRMVEGKLYLPGDDSIMEEQTRCLELLYDFNATRPSEGALRSSLLKEMFAEIGENCYIERQSSHFARAAGADLPVQYPGAYRTECLAWRGGW